METYEYKDLKNDNQESNNKSTKYSNERYDSNKVFDENDFFEIVKNLQNEEIDPLIGLNTILNVFNGDNSKFITVSFIEKTQLIDFLLSFINISTPFPIQIKVLVIIIRIMETFPITIKKIFDIGLISLCIEIIKECKDVKLVSIAFQVLITSTKCNSCYSFFDNEEFIEFLSSEVPTKKIFRSQVSLLICECLKFVNFTNLKCIQKDIFILNETLCSEEFLEIESQIICMKGLLNFIERGEKQQRFFIKKRIIEILTNMLPKLSVQAKITYFKIVVIALSNDDLKLTSSLLFLQNTTIFMNNLDEYDNNLLIELLKALIAVCKRFPSFSSLFSSTNLCDFLTMILNEKTFKMKALVVSLLSIIVKNVSKNALIEKYMNDNIIEYLIDIVEDEDIDVREKSLDILEIFINSCPEHILKDDIYQALIEGGRVEDESD